MRTTFLAAIAALFFTASTVAPAAGLTSDPPAPTYHTAGVALDTRPSAPTLDSYSNLAASAPSNVTWFEGWAYSPTFPADTVRTVADRGAIPAITWEPWDYAKGMNQPRYSLASISGGKHDAYIRSWAASARDYAGPVQIRWGHEANGSWYPWAASAKGNSAAAYVAAYRHVVDVFRATGATNVQFVWSMNVSYPGSTTLASLYPGDAYVDVVSLDGYNFGTSQRGTVWTSPSKLFSSSVNEIRAFTAKPIYISEVGSTEIGGNKAMWVSDFFAYLSSSPDISGFTWFNVNKETDWRIESSESSLAAYRSGLSAYLA